MAGSLTWSADKAIAAGLTIRPAAETARDTLAWFETLPPERRKELRAGMSLEKEAAVLAAWHSREGT
jgi:2'-hydroxyisoflavone reductase